jgi:hypothetical protein
MDDKFGRTRSSREQDKLDTASKDKLPKIRESETTPERLSAIVMRDGSV